ncbi:MAG TPA: RsmD family RNA methyltransferase [Thermoanaerobaculia bacterium]|nr:RsmD family RNA methyltransferase [Thermoanaerobaculia bacterium]
MRAKSAGRAAPSLLRISAGRWAGRRLEVPVGARPTSGRAREALFDILQARVNGARVLDLYSGSGGVGLEAASRGAARCVLVENESETLERNVARLAPDPGTVEVLALDASDALARLEGRAERFDIVFADPPYTAGPEPGVAPAIARLLASGGIYVLQTDLRCETPPAPAGLKLLRRRAYGRNVFCFFGETGQSASARGPR